MRRLFTAASSGLSKDALQWGVHRGDWQRAHRGIYAEGPEPVTELDAARARVLASSSPARGLLAGVLHGLDSVPFRHTPRRRDVLAPHRVVTVGGVPCASGLQTMFDLAPLLEDDAWEQALESALRKRLATVPELERFERWMPGAPRIRRVLARRPPGAPPTESLLETLMVQLARTVPGLNEPTRQHRATRSDGTFVARVDICWPDLGLFLELDGQHHADQPIHDARRETAVVAATGWLPGRFTWHEAVRIPRSTARRLGELVDQAARRRAA